MTMVRFFILLACFALSWACTGLFIRFAKKKKLVDMPNSRSSHSTPTPRGGGAVFAGLFLFGVLVTLLFFPEGDKPFLLAMLTGGSIISVTGWIDDVKDLAPKIRLGIQFIAVAIALFIVGGFPSLNLGFMTVPLGILGFPLALVGGVWLINLYNFMDGIDGLAAGEAIIVSLAGGLIMMRGEGYPVFFLLFILAALVGGFIIWNWSPAKVFMGDVGSGFLGFVFSVFIIVGERSGSAPALVWAVLLSVFAVDATLTLFKRIKERKNLAEAHRDHLYQKAVISGMSHRAVTAFVLVISVVVSLVAFFFGNRLFLIFITTYLVLAIAWRVFYNKFGLVVSGRHKVRS
jgi:Fuc2NAc and GlcNAc transferase